MNQEPLPAESPKSLPRSFSWPVAVAGVVLLVVIGVLYSMGEFSHPPLRSDSSSSNSFANSSSPKDEASELRSAIEKQIGKDGLSVTVNDHFDNPSQKVIQVRFEIGNNLTNGMTRRGAMMDVESILKAIDKSGINCAEVTAIGSLALVDKFGQSKKEVVLKATYEGKTIQRIIWSNFLTDDVYKVADDKWFHPAFRE